MPNQKKNFALTLSYNGNSYLGWQIQKNGVTVQGTLADAIAKKTGEQTEIVGCSRTDAGVHALSYVCNFKSGTAIPAEKMPLALNTALPRDIRVQSCTIVDDDFHARFSAESKTYIYKVYTDSISNPFLTGFAYHFPRETDVSAMQRAAEHFIGTHDFSAFVSAGSSHKTTVRTVTALSVSRKDGLIELEITADAYLYNMVRIIAGTLLYTGIGRINPTDIPSVILSGDRKHSGITAGPEGLYLARVDYGDGFGGRKGRRSRYERKKEE